MKHARTNVRPAARGRTRRFLILLAAGAPLSAIVAGCNNSGIIADYERRILGLEDQIKECEGKRLAMREQMLRLQKRTEVGPVFSVDKSQLVYPVDITIDPLTGGVDYDGRSGDDGVSVYLRPVDRDGDAVKVAGEVRIELLDLANAEGSRVVGRYEFSGEEFLQMWVGKLLSNHFVLKCPWTAGPPKHGELTVRVTFLDYLSQQVLTDQRTCRVALPP